jgi:hypothetical protein
MFNALEFKTVSDVTFKFDEQAYHANIRFEITEFSNFFTDPQTVRVPATDAVLADGSVVSTRYILVAQNGERKDHWRPVRVCAGDLDTHGSEFECHFLEITPELKAVWRRTAIDGAIPWDSSYDRTSMRLVKVETRLSDATHLLCDDADEMVTLRRQQALMKLTPEDAVLLGLENEYTIAKMMHVPFDDKEDVELLTEIHGQKHSGSLASISDLFSETAVTARISNTTWTRKQGSDEFEVCADQAA